MQSMEHHTDWVNDIVLCCGGRTCKMFGFLINLYEITLYKDTVTYYNIVQLHHGLI